MTDVTKDKLAFDGQAHGYRFVAWYLHEPKADALIEISKDGEVVKSFLWPAYKIWNIAAHAADIAHDLDAGLAVAGSDGLGGGVVARDVEVDGGTP
jgi:hypothetical protein